MREYACLSDVDTFLCAKEDAVFSLLIPLRQRIALCFHALHDGMVRWIKPHSTSLLLGTIADLAKGKSQLLVENTLLRKPLIILHRVLRASVKYFNQARPHQGIRQQVPHGEVTSVSPDQRGGRIIAVPVLGGFHHEYLKRARSKRHRVLVVLGSAFLPVNFRRMRS